MEMKIGQTNLIQLGDHLITIANNETPVILFEDEMQIPWIAATTVNCLRNGCPSVQVLITKDFARLGRDIVEKQCTEPLRTELDILQFGNERFLFHQPESRHRLLTIKRRF